MNRSEWKEYFHNKGEQDYADDKGYEPPPLGVLPSDEMIEERQHYDDGYANARDQDPDD